MKRKLILTGWYYPEYLAAAAAVYGHYKGEADVLGVSMAELAGVLDAKGGAYETIDILGVGLTLLPHQSPGTNHQAPGIPYPDNLDAAIRQHAQSVFDKFNQNLTVTKDALGVSINTLKKYLAKE